MKTLITLATCLTLAGAASAQVAPGQTGQYIGTFSARTITTDSSLKDHHKTTVACTISPDGSATIASEDGMFIQANLVSGPKYGFVSMASDFSTGTGIWKFNRRNNIKGNLQYGVRPGGDVVFIVDARLKLKKVADQAPR